MSCAIVPLRAIDNLPRISAAVTIELTRMLAASAQRATELNWAAVRTLLPPAPIDDESAPLHNWRHSWNAYQVCATTARDVARLATDHAFAQQDALWRAAEALAAGADDIESQRLQAIRASVERVQAAVDTFVAATEAALSELARHAKENRE